MSFSMKSARGILAASKPRAGYDDGGMVYLPTEQNPSGATYKGVDLVARKLADDENPPVSPEELDQLHKSKERENEARRARAMNEQPPQRFSIGGVAMPNPGGIPTPDPSPGPMPILNRPPPTPGPMPPVDGRPDLDPRTAPAAAPRPDAQNMASAFTDLTSRLGFNPFTSPTPSPFSVGSLSGGTPGIGGQYPAMSTGAPYNPQNFDWARFLDNFNDMHEPATFARGGMVRQRLHGGGHAGHGGGGGGGGWGGDVPPPGWQHGGNGGIYDNNGNWIDAQGNAGGPGQGGSEPPEGDESPGNVPWGNIIEEGIRTGEFPLIAQNVDIGTTGNVNGEPDFGGTTLAPSTLFGGDDSTGGKPTVAQVGYGEGGRWHGGYNPFYTISGLNGLGGYGAGYGGQGPGGGYFNMGGFGGGSIGVGDLGFGGSMGSVFQALGSGSGGTGNEGRALENVGGRVPRASRPLRGYGKDTVPAALTPGEMVIPRPGDVSAARRARLLAQARRMK